MSIYNLILFSLIAITIKTQAANQNITQAAIDIGKAIDHSENVTSNINLLNNVTTHLNEKMTNVSTLQASIDNLQTLIGQLVAAHNNGSTPSVLNNLLTQYEVLRNEYNTKQAGVCTPLPNMGPLIPHDPANPQYQCKKIAMICAEYAISVILLKKEFFAADVANPLNPNTTHTTGELTTQYNNVMNNANCLIDEVKTLIPGTFIPYSNTNMTQTTNVPQRLPGETDENYALRLLTAYKAECCTDAVELAVKDYTYEIVNGTKDPSLIIDEIANMYVNDVNNEVTIQQIINQVNSTSANNNQGVPI